MVRQQEIDKLRVLCLALKRVGDGSESDLMAFIRSVPHSHAADLAEPLFDRLLEYPIVRRLLPALDTVRKCEEALERWWEDGIQIVGWFDSEYPEPLRHIFNPPLILFVRGRVEGPGLSSSFKLSIVGARNCDKGGSDTAQAIAAALVRAGAVVVSGLASGIDTAAHQGALQRGSECPTIAVLGSGLHNLYPRSNVRLASEIIERGGLLVSQFEPDVLPYPSNFLDRNRIIAGLSRGVVVVQARERSGSLVTARYALEEGRDVFAVPGDIRDPRFLGTNGLIRQGAALVRSASDILEVYPELRQEEASHAGVSLVSHLREVQRGIVILLGQERAMTIMELKRRLGQPAKFQEHLLELELNGLISRLPGDRVCLRVDPSQSTPT